MQAKTGIISDIACELGEGVTYDPQGDVLWWFDILGRKLLEKRLGAGGPARVQELPFMASVIARIDARRQLVAAEEGLFVRDGESGIFQLHTPLERDKPGNRSNDGRVHPCGALWIGTMGKKAEKGAGSIYWFGKGELRTLYTDLTIPNSICFAPDGRTAFFVDTADGVLMRVACDPATGLPKGEPEPFHDGRGREGGCDGSIVDADGVLWNARWGGGALEAFAPDGSLLRSIALPVRQPSCPAFAPGGIAVTSAWEGMDEGQRKADPQAGFTLFVEIDVKPVWEPDVAL